MSAPHTIPAGMPAGPATPHGLDPDGAGAAGGPAAAIQPRLYNWRTDRPQGLVFMGCGTASVVPGNAVYIGRGTPWGNPFVIGRDGNRDQVCDRFEREVLPTLDLTPLIGRDLVCWCHPLRCHGDSILRALAERRQA